MTINEFCKMYHVSHQAVYSSIRRHEKELKDHITKNCNGDKGISDPVTGECKCIKGYTGLNCEIKT